MFGKLAEAQQKAQEIKNKLERITVEGRANIDKVRITCTANKNIKQIDIDPSLLTPERREELQDLILIAIDDAMTQAENIAQSEMKQLMGSMMPGFGNFLGK